MNRTQLDDLVGRYQLSPDAARLALELANARPSRAESLRFMVRSLQLAGALSLAAGIIFFIAANWDAFGKFGRFILIEAVFVASIGVALWRPPPHALGRYSLLMAFIMTGALLALFGQTYQTGADVYELFLSWAMLGVVFAIVGRWSVLWAAWIVVLNTALWLFSGFNPQTGLLWLVFGRWQISLAEILLMPMIVNVLLWILREYLEYRKDLPETPRWIGRLILTGAIVFGTWAGIVAIFGSDEFGPPGADGVVLLVVLATWAAIGAHAMRSRVDVYPLALLAASLIVLTSCAIGEALDVDELALFFVLSVWLIASSTFSGRVLMHLVRTWDREEASE